MTITIVDSTGNDVSYTSAATAVADNSAAFIAGWVYPTILTAGNTYFSWGNTAGVKVAPTTSEIRVTTQNATTNGIWDSTGAGITVNDWWFIAIMTSTENTTVAGAVKMWVGHWPDIPPTELTVTNTTARSGNYTGSTSVTVGNLGTGAVGVDGAFGWSIRVQGNNNTAINNWHGLVTSGTMTQAETDRIRDRLVYPIWLGRLPAESVANGLFIATQTIAASYLQTDRLGMHCTEYNIDSGSTPATANRTVTDNSAGWNWNRPPVPYLNEDRPLHHLNVPRVRR